MFDIRRMGALTTRDIARAQLDLQSELHTQDFYPFFGILRIGQ
jgi:hypothetical protein